jgi:HlyD family secretion protein
MRVLTGGGWVVGLVVLGVGTREARAVAPPAGPARLPAVVRPWQEVSLFAPVDGVVRAVSVDIGQWVKKGEVLVRLDVPELEHKVKRTKAVVREREAEVLLAKASAQAARAGVAVARNALRRAKAELAGGEATLRFRQAELKRLTDLAGKEAVGPSLVNEARLRFEAAREAFEAAKAHVGEAAAALAEREALIAVQEAKVAVARARLEVSGADLEQVEALLALAVIRSPLDGVVVQRTVFAGDAVRRAAPGAGPLVKVHQVDRVRVVAAVPDARVPWVAVGDPVTVVVAALPREKIAGKVARLSVGEGKGRVAHLEVDLPNPGGKLLPGMTAEVSLPAPREKR